MWREDMESIKGEFPDVELSHMYVDNAAMQLVRNPKQFDVVVTTNMFGDILSDCAAMLTGSPGCTFGVPWELDGLAGVLHCMSQFTGARQISLGRASPIH